MLDFSERVSRMAIKLKIEEAAQIAEGAFAPMRCAATFEDRRNKLRVAVFAEYDNPAIPPAVLVGGQFRDPRRLKSNLSQLRSLVERKHKTALAPWKFPERAIALPNGKAI